MVARVGGISAPYVALYLPTIMHELPMLIMGGASLIGGLMAFLLPETLGRKLPESFEDVTDMKKQIKPMCSCVMPEQIT